MLLFSNCCSNSLGSCRLLWHLYIESSRGLSMAKLREHPAARFPKPDAASILRKLPEPKRTPEPQPTTLILPALATAQTTPAPTSLALSAPQPVTAASPPPRATPRPIEPLAPERYKLQLTASRHLKHKLEQCRDLMRHANPSRDFAPIVERGLDLLLDQLMRERFGAAKRPRAPKKAPSSRLIERAIEEQSKTLESP